MGRKGSSAAPIRRAPVAAQPAPPPDDPVNADAEVCKEIGCSAAEFAKYAEGARVHTEWTEVEAEYKQYEEQVTNSRKEGIQWPEGIPPFK